MTLRLAQTIADGGRWRAIDIAERIGTSPQYVAQLVAPLTRARWVRSVPGPRGGYELDIDLAEASVFDLIVLVEGAPDPDRCVMADRPCPAPEPCALHDAWVPARDELIAQLSATSLTLEPGSYTGRLVDDGSIAHDIAVGGDEPVVAAPGETVDFDHCGTQDRPIEVPTGDSVRFYVLDVGPSIDSSFHIVGTTETGDRRPSTSRRRRARSSSSRRRRTASIRSSPTPSTSRVEAPWVCCRQVTVSRDASPGPVRRHHGRSTAHHRQMTIPHRTPDMARPARFRVPTNGTLR